jgi:hypothetical protein
MNPKVPKIPFLEKHHQIYFSLECYYFFSYLQDLTNLSKFFAKIEQTFFNNFSRVRFYIWYSLCQFFCVFSFYLKMFCVRSCSCKCLCCSIRLLNKLFKYPRPYVNVALMFAVYTCRAF